MQVSYGKNLVPIFSCMLFFFSHDFKAQDQQGRHSEIMKAKEDLAKKNQEFLQLHSLLNETEQLLVRSPTYS